MRVTRGVVVYRRIRGGKPLPDSLLQVIACEEVSASAIHDRDVKRKRTPHLVHAFYHLLQLYFTHGQTHTIVSVSETHQEPLGYCLSMFSHLSEGTLSTALSTSSERFTDLP